MIVARMSYKRAIQLGLIVCKHCGYGPDKHQNLGDGYIYCLYGDMCRFRPVPVKGVSITMDRIKRKKAV